MAEIKTPIGIFADINGKPLDDGYIFIGQAGLDAESNQINVFWDAEFTVPATQPIRTIAGYPSNAGVPGRIYVDASDYSIVTKNKRQTPVKSTNSNNADLTGFFTKLEGTISLGQTTIATDREGGDPGGALLPDGQEVFLRHNPRIDVSGSLKWSITGDYQITIDPATPAAGGETFTVQQNADDILSNSSGYTVKNYTEMRAIPSGYFEDGEVINVSDDGISGIFVVKSGSVQDDGHRKIVFSDNVNRYAERLSDYEDVEPPTPKNLVQITKGSRVGMGIDSLSAGASQSNITKYLRTIIKESLGQKGFYAPFDTSWYQTEADASFANVGLTLMAGGDMSSDPIKYSPDGRGVYIAAGTGAEFISASVKQEWTKATIYYLIQPGGGSFDYYLTTLGSGTAITEPTDGAVNLGKAELLKDVNSNGAIRIDVTGKVALFGVMFENEKIEDGAYFFTVAQGGKRLEEFVDDLDPTFKSLWRDEFAFDVFFLNAGTNDVSQGVPSADFSSDMNSYISNSLLPTCRVVIIEPAETDKWEDDAFVEEMFNYADVRRALGVSHDYFDYRTIFGTFSQANANGFMVDTTHPNSDGNRTIAKALASRYGLSETNGIDPEIYYQRNGRFRGFIVDAPVVGGQQNGASPFRLYRFQLDGAFSSALIEVDIKYLNTVSSKTSRFTAVLQASTDGSALPSAISVKLSNHDDWDGDVGHTPALSVLAGATEFDIDYNGSGDSVILTCSTTFTYLSKASDSLGGVVFTEQERELIFR